MPFLTILVLLPLFGAILLAILPDSRQKEGVMLGLTFGLVTFLWSLGTLVQVKPATFHFQLAESYPWVEKLGLGVKFGIDGVSYWLVLLTTFLTLIGLAMSHAQKHRPKTFIALILLVETALLGSFLSLDLILFFTFFELMLLPTYFLMSIWGGEGRKRAAAKFLIYTFAGSIFLLVGIVALAVQYQSVTGSLSFGIAEIQSQIASGRLWNGNVGLQNTVFWLFAIALLVKTPAFPFHSWIPDTYAESPIVGPMLSSVMVKLGTYGFLRFCLPFFPEASVSQAPVLLGLATIGILYGAIVAAVQTDLRRMIAYSSLSHMGFILLGIFSLSHVGLMGSSVQQFNHGITTGLLILLVAYLLSRQKSTDFAMFGGLKAKAPILAAVFLLGMLGSVGLPGTNGFIGEFMALMGTFQSSPGVAAAATFGVVLGAVYLLYMFQQIFYGPDRAEHADFLDLRPQELVPALLFVAFILWGGLQPNAFLAPMESSLQATRMMAVNPVGARPSWGDLSLEIAAGGEQRGALVRVDGSRVLGVPVEAGTLVSPANVLPSPVAESATVAEVAH